MSFACKTLKTEINDGFVTLWLSRPSVCNAFNAELISDLKQFCSWIDAAEQKNLRGVFLRGEGKLFCAGGDLNWMRDSLQWDAAENQADSKRLSAMFTALNQITKPLIGVIQGGAYGGGVGLVAVCDHVICEEKTQFSLSEVRLGLIPACIGPFVLEKVGASQARSLFISGERFGAQKAFAIGLVHEVVPSEADFQGRMQTIKKNLSGCGPHAIKTAKSFLRQVATLPKEAAHELAAKTLADLRVGAEAQEGIRAFFEKRAPKWP